MHPGCTLTDIDMDMISLTRHADSAHLSRYSSLLNSKSSKTVG